MAALTGSYKRGWGELPLDRQKLSDSIWSGNRLAVLIRNSQRFRNPYRVTWNEMRQTSSKGVLLCNFSSSKVNLSGAGFSALQFGVDARTLGGGGCFWAKSYQHQSFQSPPPFFWLLFIWLIHPTMILQDENIAIWIRSWIKVEKWHWNLPQAKAGFA